MTTAVCAPHVTAASTVRGDFDVGGRVVFASGNSRGGEIEPPSIRNGQLQARRRFMVFA